MHLKEIKQTIKMRREILNITQQDLAEISDVGLRTIKLLETGHGNPTYDTLSKVADVLGMELELRMKE